MKRISFFKLVLLCGTVVLLIICGFIYIKSRRNDSEIRLSTMTNKNINGSATLTLKPTPQQGGVGQSKQVNSNHQARNIYINTSLSRAERLVNLAALAADGNLNAKELSYQIAMDCDLWTKAANDPSTVGNSRADVRALVQDALARISQGCGDVKARPEYSGLEVPDETTGELYPRDYYDADIRQHLKQTFADYGKDKTLSEALFYLRERPDMVTQQVVLDSLSELGIDDVFITSLLPDNLGVSQHRPDLLPYALTLLQCDSGVPCGPDSDIALSYCILANVCLQGASVKQLYAERMLSGADMEYVMKVLSALEKIPVSSP